jgi:hypothetical protein
LNFSIFKFCALKKLQTKKCVPKMIPLKMNPARLRQRKHPQQSRVFAIHRKHLKIMLNNSAAAEEASHEKERAKL